MGILKKISLFGVSYLGVAAWQAASYSEQKISTLIPWFTSSDPYNLWYDKGVLYLKQSIFWMSTYGGSKTENILHEKVDRALSQTVDWKELDWLVRGKKLPAYRDFLTHPLHDNFWRQFSIPLSEMNQDIPVLLGSGWYDQFLQATIDDFKVLILAPVGSKRRESRLILGPWTHHPTRKIEALNLRADANFLKQLSIMLKWYQKWMGEKQIFELAPVTYYLMGENQWHTASDWPPPEAKMSRFYLDSSQENKLSEKSPPDSESHLLFETDNFVPSFGGRMLYGNDKEGPQDQLYLKQRRDVLFWTTSYLEHELPIVGAPKLHLYLSQTPLNFDLSIKLIDLFPDGKMQLVTNGYIRVQGKENHSPFPVEVQLADTAYVFRAGHRLQITITHSDFPSHAPNKQLMGISKASITILTGSGHPSYLEILNLPQLP